MISANEKDWRWILIDFPYPTTDKAFDKASEPNWVVGEKEIDNKAQLISGFIFILLLT